MSQIPPGNTPSDPNAPSPALVVRRRASVNLRSESDATDAGMDPANQSLADALKITYRILQFAMIAMIAVFIFSGLQKVDTNERGVRLQFGAIQNDALDAGPQFSLPRPLGEILRVPKTEASIRLDTDFMPQFQNRGDENKTEAELAAMGGKPDLNPVTDGSLLTGDLNIAHARFSVAYVVNDNQVREFIEHVRFNEPDAGSNTDAKLVAFAVRRGAVRAAASISIDELRRGQPDAIRAGKPFQTLEERTREIAQATLDDLKTGIQIKSLKLDRRMVPVRLINDFNKVEQNLSQAKTTADEARQKRSAVLAQAAGDAAPTLLKLIDQYDAQYSAGKSAEADETLAKIDAIFEGREIELEGQKVTPRLSGAAATRMSEAQQYRSSIVSKAQSDAGAFKAKLAAYKANPAVLLTGEWADAVSAFVGRDLTQVYMVGPDSPLQLWFNRDPELQKRIETRRNELRAIELQRQNQKIDENSKFVPVKTETSGTN
ncbi:MAG: SPFH domain-containing protein [Phycisphaerales bacterium]